LYSCVIYKQNFDGSSDQKQTVNFASFQLHISLDKALFCITYFVAGFRYCEVSKRIS
jgi:hypothetical protein